MADDFFGGFAQGFASTYARRSKNSFAEALGIKRLELDQEKFDYQKQTTEQRMQMSQEQLDLQRGQAESLNAHREWQRGLQEKQFQLEEKKADLDIAGKLVGLLDSKYSPGARKAGMKMFAMALGVDPKSPQFGAMTDLLTNLDEEESQAIRDYIADFAPNAKPGEVKGVIQMMFKDPSAALDMLKSVTEGPDVNMTSIVDPNDPNSNIYVRKEDAIGQTPAPSGMYQTPQEALRIEEGKLVIASDSERYKRITEQADISRGIKENLAVFSAALNAGNQFVTGPGAEFRYNVGRWIQFLGLEDQIDMEALALGGTEAAELMRTSGAKIVAGMADQLGRTTNMQLSFLQETIPNLLKSPTGNKLLVDIFQKSVNRDIAAQQEMERYIDEYGTFRPPGKPSVWQSINSMNLANPIVDDNIIEQMSKVSKENQGIDLSTLFGETEKAVESVVGGGEGEDGAPNNPNNTAVGNSITLGESSYNVSKLENIGDVLYRFVQIDAPYLEGGSAEVPVVWDKEQYNNLPEGATYITKQGTVAIKGTKELK